MRDSGKLACVLFQFPWSFKPSTSNVQYVLSLKERMPYSEVVVEFRNSLWASQDTCKYLSGKEMCIRDRCKVPTDMPAAHKNP